MRGTHSINLKIFSDGQNHFIAGLIRSGSTVQWKDGSPWQPSLYGGLLRYSGGTGAETYFTTFFYVNYYQMKAHTGSSWASCQLSPF